MSGLTGNLRVGSGKYGWCNCGRVTVFGVTSDPKAYYHASVSKAEVKEVIDNMRDAARLEGSVLQEKIGETKLGFAYNGENWVLHLILPFRPYTNDSLAISIDYHGYTFISMTPNGLSSFEPANASEITELSELPAFVLGFQYREFTAQYWLSYDQYDNWSVMVTIPEHYGEEIADSVQNAPNN